MTTETKPHQFIDWIDCLFHGEPFKENFTYSDILSEETSEEHRQIALRKIKEYILPFKGIKEGEETVYKFYDIPSSWSAWTEKSTGCTGSDSLGCGIRYAETAYTVGEHLPPKNKELILAAKTFEEIIEYIPHYVRARASSKRFEGCPCCLIT